MAPIDEHVVENDKSIHSRNVRRTVLLHWRAYELFLLLKAYSLLWCDDELLGGS